MTIVDRHSKFLLMVRVPRRRSDIVSDAVVFLPGSVGNPCHTIIFDNGKEVADQWLISDSTGAPAYFAASYHSWERGLSKHTNGLVRRFLIRSPIPDSQSARRVGRRQCNWRGASCSRETPT